MKQYFIILFILSLTHINAQKTDDLLEKIELKEIDNFNFKEKNFDITSVYNLEKNFLVIGNYIPINGKITFPDTIKDYGIRILFLNDKKEITYKSHGLMDVWHCNPTFYKNGSKFILVCQLSMEQDCGLEVYVIENTNIKFIGNINVETSSEESQVINFLKIRKQGEKLIFSFKSDTLLLNINDKFIKKSKVEYEYFKNKLVLLN
ncbi:hypothetical protein [Aquimarina longa]|uniref:hypothetical protein n=1 Tax=Aquimarina longa TaxID=1080221 RepID=UPI0007812CD1|nr:hypothetical protein [Aquimarina longa]